MTKAFLCAGCMSFALLAAGCGNSHNSNNAGPAQQEDAAASGSVAGLVGFAQSQIARTDDASEPRPIAGINPPVSETDEPAVI